MKGLNLGRLLILVCLLTQLALPISLRKDSERKRAPAFELRDSQGRLVRLADFAGKVVLIDFWATWCGPCRSSIPWFNELSKTYGNEGFTILGITLDQDGWEVVKPFMAKMNVQYPVLMGSKRVAYLYGDVDALPVAFFVDRNQRLAAIHPGAASRKDFEKIIQALLAEGTGNPQL